MSYNGSGTFQINTSGQPVVTGTIISSTAFNSLTADLATGLSTAITKDGQTSTTVRIPFAQGINSTLVTDSTSTSTGSIITAGGVGIAKALFVGTTTNVAGVATFGSQPILSSLTASKPVFTDASKGLVSTGTLGADQGGTGVANNAAMTVTGSGNFAYTRTLTAATNVTFPTTGTLISTTTLSTYLTSKIQPITASVASSAMTVTLNPTVLDFRSTPLTSGTVNTRTVSAAISMVVSSGSTLGTVSAQQSRIVVIALDNAGTIELAVVNISGGNNLDETTLISTTAEGGAGAADSANVIYSTTARTSLPFRVVGYVESTQATAGTWATAPSTIQGYGGQALAAMSSLGYSQTWQNVLSSRATTVVYYNTTGRPIAVTIGIGSTGGGSYRIDGVQVGLLYAASGTIGSQTFFVVPPGSNYSATSANFGSWFELR